MKLIFVVLTATEAVSDFVSTKQGEFIGQVSTYLRKLDTFLEDEDGIKNHGCWCAKLKGDAILQLGGEPTDELDMLCKTWYTKRHCIKLAGGFCEEENYTDYGINLVDDNGKLKISEQAKIHCNKAGSRCQKQICLIDHEFISEIRNFRRLTATPADQCFRGDYGQHEQKYCNGNAPDVEIVKGSPEPTNCHTEVSTVFNHFVPTYMELCRSMNKSTAIALKFCNKYDKEIKIYWLNFSGKLRLYDSIASNDCKGFLTFATFPWLIKTVEEFETTKLSMFIAAETELPNTKFLVTIENDGYSDFKIRGRSRGGDSDGTRYAPFKFTI